MGTVSNVFALFFQWMPNWVRMAILAVLALLLIIIVVKVVALVLDALPFV